MGVVWELGISLAPARFGPAGSGRMRIPLFYESQMIDDVSRATYLRILMEIKYRIEAVDQVLAKSLPVRAKIGEELIVLQFRLVAELIAIGCLVLRQDIAVSKDGVLAKAWNAGQIFKRLSRLHDSFYPQPLEPVAAVGDKFQWVNLKAPYMTKDALLHIYDQEFGARLHRGNYRRIFRVDPPLDFTKLGQWRQEIVNLLNRHTVISADREYICHFNMCPVGEYPTASLFQRQERAPLGASCGMES